MKKAIVGLTNFILLSTLFLQAHTIASNTNNFSLQEKNKKPAKTKTNYLTIPYNESIRIVPGFLGHDFKAILNVLKERKKSSQKREFETTQEFNERIKNESIKPILGTVNLDSKLAFVTTTFIHNSFSTSYDADSSSFSIEIKSSHTNPFDGTFLHHLEITELGTYTATNSYGATTEVKKIQLRKWGLSPSRPIQKENIRLTMNRDTAINFKQNISLMFICKIIKSDPIKEESFVLTPTFKYPREGYYTKDFLNVDILEIKIFDNSTGIVYHTIKL